MGVASNPCTLVNTEIARKQPLLFMPPKYGIMMHNGSGSSPIIIHYLRNNPKQRARKVKPGCFRLAR